MTGTTRERLDAQIAKLDAEVNALKCENGRGWCSSCATCARQDAMVREINALREERFTRGCDDADADDNPPDLDGDDWLEDRFDPSHDID